MLRRYLAAVAVSLALVSGLAASPAHAAGKGLANANGCSNGSSKGQQQNPNCQIPEAPWPIGLPIVGLGVLGGYVVLMRRRDPAGRSAGILGTG
jgi:hypothetical protein